MFEKNKWLRAKDINPINQKNKNILNLNNTNLPWLYNDTIPAVRKLIQLRYQLLPILYSAIWRFYKEGEPVIRPLFLDFPEKEHFEQEEVFSIKSLGKNNYQLIAGPYTSINTLKNDYFKLNKYGFDNLDQSGWALT